MLRKVWLSSSGAKCRTGRRCLRAPLWQMRCFGGGEPPGTPEMPNSKKKSSAAGGVLRKVCRMQWAGSQQRPGFRKILSRFDAAGIPYHTCARLLLLRRAQACSPSCARLCSSYARRRASSTIRAREHLRGELHLKMSAPAVAETPGHSSRHTRSSLAQRAILGGRAVGWWTPRALLRAVAKHSSLRKGSSRAQRVPLRALRTSGRAAAVGALQSGSSSPSTGRRSCWLQHSLGAGCLLALRCLR